MYNHVFVVGRIESLPDETVFENNPNKDALMILRLEQPFQVGEDEIEFDLIPAVLWNGMAEMVNGACKIGSLVAVTGRLINLREQPYFKQFPVIVLRGEKVEILDRLLEEKG
ncbi:single-stranded DNA-binding protein [Eggerthia catenaformis]|uniref:single-stranded DNA-binding protein n=1 Tax=Eggerthia catenaformis TaxID=31973 RepID=UPI00248D879D|nr:single-stranded DNA-binding protein [Eggerthia catenaformis]